MQTKKEKNCRRNFILTPRYDALLKQLSRETELDLTHVVKLALKTLGEKQGIPFPKFEEKMEA